jgi:pseudouridine synthase
MAAAGVASRRRCEELVEEGRVTVNGRLVEALPAWVDTRRDRIAVDGKPVAAPAPPTRGRRHRGVGGPPGPEGPQGRVYVAVHKPRQTISTTEDPEGRRSVLDLVPRELAAGRRLFPVGRLDADSTGLMLLTDDGELAQRLTHPSYGVSKLYQVSVAGKLDDEAMSKLRKGLFLVDRPSKPGKAPTGRKSAPAAVRRLGYARDRNTVSRTVLLITLTEGRNREIRRMLAKVGHKVQRINRLGIGPLQLKGMAVGAARPLSPVEVAKLRADVGLGPPARGRR